MASPGFKQRRTPGVYISELSAFPPAIVGIQTAVPAFIGYTEKAEIDGKPVFNKAIKIGSLADFELIFGKNFKSTYKIVKLKTDAIKNGEYDFKVRKVSVIYDEKKLPVKRTPGEMVYYNLKQQSTSQFNLYESMKLFYANGGGNCYVVSVGAYRTLGPDGKTMTDNKVSLTDLQRGLAVIKEQVGPTMLVIPEAILLPKNPNPKDAWDFADFKSLSKDMLKQCAELQDRVALLDVCGAEHVTTENLNEVITAFRKGLDENLNYGMAYFPFLRSTVSSVADHDYTRLLDGDQQLEVEGKKDEVDEDVKLKNILDWVNADLYFGTSRFTQVSGDIDKMDDEATIKSDEAVRTLNQNLTAALPLLLDMERIVTGKDDVLPPSPALAGIFTRTDATKGVWNAPANTSLDAVTTVTYKLNNTQQADLNIPVDGKAVNALREFPNRGTVVWGARTLDGNSADWRYIQVRRTLIYIEQSIKSALDQFVFAPNDGNTWVSVTSMVSNFLQGLWSQGGLMGATANEAFSVECGLGSTMTAQDILDGYLIVQVTVQMVRPAEFIELTFKQKMEGSA